MRKSLLVLCCSMMLLALARPVVAQQACESLMALKLLDTTITAAESVAAGAFTGAPPPIIPSRSFKSLPAFCRVTGVIKPTSDSDIRFEVWLPSAGWNGKFQGIGNGGYAGAIDYGTPGLSGLAGAISRGSAAAATDTGHQGKPGDAAWAVGHPEKVIDYGYRAIHLMTVQGKAVVKAFYGKPPARSYFSACSNGGRQALMEAQRYPDDYDGIIAGAPANNFTGLVAAHAWNMQTLEADPAAYISARKLPALEAAALAACDALDGAKDELIDEPLKCKFDPAVLLCKGEETDKCLTPLQLAALKKIYDGPRDKDGKLIFPGFPPGGESGGSGWGGWITGAAGPGQSGQFVFGTRFFKYMVFEDEKWDYRKLDVGRDAQIAEKKLGRILNSTDPNLKAFQARGGKLILYHGWCDAAIPLQNTRNYYDSVAAKLGARQTASFVRFYPAPGMHHCALGPGPSMFGQLGAPLGDANHDITAALERWVEQGVAPDRIIAVKWKSTLNPDSGVARSGLLCPYPLVARYNGSG
ncbi:MAG: tannase/feruloyl esterase family alpha/beta hydrolase, partial [Blastocatellia bacterium]